MIKLAMSQGIFAVLFVALLFYVLKHNERREERLMQCLENLPVEIRAIRDDVKEIKEDIEVLKERTGT